MWILRVRDYKTRILDEKVNTKEMARRISVQIVLGVLGLLFLFIITRFMVWGKHRLVRKTGSHPRNK